MSKHGRNIKDFFGPQSQLPKSTPAPPPQSIPLASPVTSKPRLAPGKVEVENSDEEDGDSDSSLESLTDIMRARRENTTNSNTTSASISKRPSPPRNRNPVLWNSPVKKKYKFDLKSLVREAKKDNATEISAKRVQDLYDDEARNSSGSGSGSGGGNSRDEQEIDATAMVIDAATEDREDGGAQRVVQALKRTEAMDVQQRWYFFDTALTPKTPRKRFPAKAIKKDSWQHDLINATSRQQTMECGIAKDMVGLGESLPDEAVLWILDDIQSVSQNTLRCAYCNLIDALPGEQLEQVLQPEVVRKIFKGMGGSDEAIEIGQRISTRAEITPDPYLGRSWDAVSSMISLLGRVGPRIQSSIQKDIICMIARLCLDRVVMLNLDLLAACQGTFSSLIKSSPDNTWEKDLQDISQTIYDLTDSNPLRVQMLRCIPAHSPRLKELRRRLSLSFFLDDPSLTKWPSSSSFSLSRVTAQLHKTQFDITESTNYANLAALMTLLDISVDTGHSMQLDLQDKNAEKAFNEDVDILLTRVKNIWSSITDTGASYFSRLEAKEVIDGVRYRLMFGVRTKQKPKKTAFDPKKGEEDLTLEKRGMAGFLKIANASKTNTSPCIKEILE